MPPLSIDWFLLFYLYIEGKQLWSLRHGNTFTASRLRKTKVNLMLIYLLPIIGDCNPHKYAHINSIYVVAVVERCYVIYTRQDKILKHPLVFYSRWVQHQRTVRSVLLHKKVSKKYLAIIVVWSGAQWIRVEWPARQVLRVTFLQLFFSVKLYY